jgi:hypothetical protein
VSTFDLLRLLTFGLCDVSGVLAVSAERQDRCFVEQSSEPGILGNARDPETVVEVMDALTAYFAGQGGAIEGEGPD